jgi:hypothetical protein
MPADTFSHRATSGSSPDEVLAALERADTWRGIGPIDEVWDERHDGETLGSFSWQARAAGRSWEGTAKRLDAPDDSVRFALDSPEVTGVITVHAVPLDTGAEIFVELQARSKGMLAGMFWGVISDVLRRGLPDQVEAFASGL